MATLFTIPWYRLDQRQDEVAYKEVASATIQATKDEGENVVKVEDKPESTHIPHTNDKNWQSLNAARQQLKLGNYDG